MEMNSIGIQNKIHWKVNLLWYSIRLIENSIFSFGLNLILVKNGFELNDYVYWI
jgi:hypothetical protein